MAVVIEAWKIKQKFVPIKFKVKMAVILFKRFQRISRLGVCSILLLLASSLWLVAFSSHPYYMSVTEIEYKAGEKELQIACKLFADDFEDVLKAENNKIVSIFDEVQKTANLKMMNTYLQQHFKITVDGTIGVYKLMGFEKEGEAVWVYIVAKDVSKFKKLNVWSDIFYKYRTGQINIIHFKNMGKTKSQRLSMPTVQHTFLW